MVIHQNGINFAKLQIADKNYNFCFRKISYDRNPYSRILQSKPVRTGK